MPSYFIFGRRRNDLGLMVDFFKQRAIVRANTALIEGVYLEDIPESPNGFKPGMVLINRKWNGQYFLMERPGWKDEDYFKLAERKMESWKNKKS